MSESIFFFLSVKSQFQKSTAGRGDTQYIQMVSYGSLKTGNEDHLEKVSNSG